MRRPHTIALVTGLMLLTPGVSRAETSYKIQAIVAAGDQVGDLPARLNRWLSVGALNDAGQIVFDTLYPSGPQSIVQYADGKFTLIMVGGRDAPGGKWPLSVGTHEPIGMNQSGMVVFAAQISLAGNVSAGTFLWDPRAQKAAALALKGMPAANNLTFADGGGWAPVINNRNEVALVAPVPNAAGRAQSGIFLLGQERRLAPVALPDQALPGGGALTRAWRPSLNDRGTIAFLGRRTGDTTDSAYLWEQGALTRLAGVDMDLPGGGRIASVRGVWVNSKNRNVLLLARTTANNATSNALYLLANGILVPVAVAGQEMPGGGKFRDLQFTGGEGLPTGVSAASESGQHAFLAALESGDTAAYRMDAEGKLSLIVRSGMTTELGTIESVGFPGGKPSSTVSNGVGLNNKGQVALSVKIAGGRDTLVLLTPATP